MKILLVVLDQPEQEQGLVRHEGPREPEQEQEALSVQEGQRDVGREGLAGEAREHVVQEHDARVQSRLEPDPEQKTLKQSSHSQVQPSFAQLANFLTNAPADVISKYETEQLKVRQTATCQ